MGELASVLKKESVVLEDEEDDQFYEEIEAPKFVDFRVPDRSRPDDRLWFCVRVGCDQKHEDVDPDALHRSFVLRVMAARSPNLRLRKALSGQPASSIAKCPRSAPAKSAKDRLQQLDTIAVIPGKISNIKLRDYPISNLRSTPNHAKAKEQPSIAEKALTTPRNKRLPPKGEPISRSVQIPKVHVPVLKNKKVAKTLVFNTPKKDGKTATFNYPTPISEMCAGTKDLDIGSHKHLCRPSQSARNGLNYSKPASVPAKLRTNGSKSSSRGEEGSVILKKSDCLVTKEGVRNDVSDLKTDGSLPSLVELPVEENVQSVVADSTSYDNPSDLPKFEENDSDEKISIHTSDKLQDEKKVKEKSLDTDENKENASATGENREMTLTIINPETENIQHEISEYPSKTIQIATKAYKDHSVQGGRCKRMKSTNPKPFRLRTDERGILKEANLERRMQIGAQRETVSVTRRHNEGRVILASNKSARCAEPKIVADTPRRQKWEKGKVKVTQKLKDRSPKLAMLQKLIKPQSMSTERKKGTCTSRPKERATHESQSDNTSRIIPSRYRRSTTVPKEPNFHRIHTPKSCTKRSEKGR